MNIRIKQMAFALASALTGRQVTKHYGERIGRKDDPSDLVKMLEKQLDSRDLKLNGLIAKSNDEVSRLGKASEKTTAEIAEMVKKSAELQDTLNALTTEIAALKSAPQNDPKNHQTLGEAFTGTKDFEQLATNGRGSAFMRVKAIATISTAGTSGTGVAGGMILPDRQPGVVTPAQREFTIRDLLIPGRTSSNSIEYVKETGYQNMAAAVAEGATKPQSDLTFAVDSTTVKTLAHWVRATKQILADVPMLQSYIDTRMIYGLKFVEETQLLAGDGTGANLLGLIPQATDYDVAADTPGDTKIDTIRRAILQARIALYPASGIVLNPTDWADIEMQKDSTGQYIWVNVTQGGIPQLWRLPVVQSDAMPAGDFMVGAFTRAAQVFDREDAVVEVSTEDQDNFIKNLVTIRAEERLALVVYRPEALIYGTFAQNGTTPIPTP